MSVHCQSNDRKIKDNVYEFPTQDPISQEAQDLITSLLNPDPTNRPSIDEISDHKFFHAGEMPREIPSSSLVYPPQWAPISKPMSELNWRYVSVQAGLGKNVQVGTDAGKSIQACIASNENPVKNHVTRLREQESGVAKVDNVLPVTLSPRVPAPAVGGVEEGRLMGKGAKRSVRKVSAEENKENLMMDLGRSLKTKGTTTKKGAMRMAVQQVFEGIAEEPEGEAPKARPRRLAPPSRKPSGNLETEPAPAISNQPKSSSISPIEPMPALSKRVNALRESGMGNIDLVAGRKRTSRGTTGQFIPVKLPNETDLNGTTRGSLRSQAQPPTLKRSERDVASGVQILENISYLGCAGHLSIR
jgi:serine/threonine protein kinase